MHHKIIPYNPILKKLAKQLRQNSTRTEVMLWQFLKGKKILGHDFDRQKPIDEYIVDFYCKTLCLAIEIDGSTHGEKIEYDNFRQKKLEDLGIKFLRFNNSQVKNDIDSVLRTIHDWIIKHERPEPTHPYTPPRRG